MAPKRNIKSRILNNCNRYDKLLLNDVTCPICRTILIEPVTLPCNHAFCLSCFNNSMENTNLVCPLCRLRISSWFRLSKKDNKLINKNFWEAIQKSFPGCIQEKLQGNEQCVADDVQRQIARVGEIRLEYEIQKAKEVEQLRKEQEAERKASEDYISKLREQEKHEERIRTENLRLSEQLARKLSTDYSIDPGSSNCKINSESLSQVNKKQMPLDRFLTIPKEYTCKTLTQNASSNSSLRSKETGKIMEKYIRRGLTQSTEETSDNDCITSECRYFKPIDRKCVPVVGRAPVVRVPAFTATANTVIIGAPKGKTNFTHATRNSPFAVVRILIPVSNSEVEVISCFEPTASTIDATITKISKLNRHSNSVSNVAQHRHPSARPLISSSRNLNKPYTSVSDSNSVDLVLHSISKRKRSNLSPLAEENVPIKQSKMSVISNSSLLCKNAYTTSENCKSEISKSVSSCQEENDFKLAMKLHNELNNLNNYPTQSSISIPVRSTRKSTRQVTLKEILSQAASI